jgi:hypothetical protein
MLGWYIEPISSGWHQNIYLTRSGPSQLLSFAGAEEE